VLLLRLSYKRNSGGVRVSRALPIARQLGERVRDRPAVRVEPTDDETSKADTVVLITDHEDFPYDRVTDLSSFEFDTRHRLRGDNVENL